MPASLYLYNTTVYRPREAGVVLCVLLSQDPAADVMDPREYIDTGKNAMPPKQTPTSSLSGSHAAYFSSSYLTTVTATATELFAKRVLYRTLARIGKMRSGGGVSPETSTTHNSPTTRLPLEVAETIVAHLAYDKSSLRACALKCYSWYITAVPYLHRALTINGIKLNTGGQIPSFTCTRLVCFP